MPLALLNDVFRRWKGKLGTAILVVHDDTAGMIKVAVGEDHKIDIMPTKVEFLQVCGDIPLPGQTEDLLLFGRQLVAQTGFHHDQCFGCFDQEWTVE